MYVPAQHRTEQIKDGSVNERHTAMPLNIAYLYYTLLRENVYTTYMQCVRVCVCMYVPAQFRTEHFIDGGMNERRTQMTLNIAYLHNTLLHTNVQTTYIEKYTYT